MKFRAIFGLFFITATLIFPAIKITSIKNDFNEKLFADDKFQSETRIKINIAEGWTVYPENNPTKKADLSIPIIFEGDATLVFENTFHLTHEQIENYNVIFTFSGLSYYSEITINEQGIIKHPYGVLPFTFTAPSEILLPDEENTIKIKINSQLNSSSTIPQLQRFLFPEHKGGILGKVFLTLIPKNRIATFDYSFELFKKKKKNFAKINFDILTETDAEGSFSIKVTLFDSKLNPLVTASANAKSKSPRVKTTVLLESPALWEPSNPRFYYAKIELGAAGKLLDETFADIPLLSAEIKENMLCLNGKPVKISGFTYVPFSKANNPDYSYKQIKKDLELAKSLGFNFVRFTNQLPDKTILGIAANLGLMVSVEIPMNFLPEDLLSDEVFSKILNVYADEFIENYSSFFNIIFLGAGNSLLPNSPKQINYVNRFSQKVKKAGKFSFASFLDLPDESVNVDFINVEFYSRFSQNKQEKIKRGSNVFVTGTYPAFKGSKPGSLNENSFEAQGAFFKKILNFAEKEKLPGFFINSLTDYSGDFASLYCSHNSQNLYKIGIVGTDRKAKRIGYNVLREKLRKGKNVIIPLGSKREAFPLLFVVLPLFLAALIAFVINSRNKFREDAKRALLRSYNFFADIRDLRLLSGFHSYFMFIVNSATISLLIVNILYFLRNNIAFDKIILSLGSTTISDMAVYLAWHPLNAFAIIFVIILIKFILLALLLKFFSIFNETRVFFSNIFYTIVWAVMPVNLLIPVELLLLKALGFNVANIYIYSFLIIYMIWLLLRIFKGIYVVFDVRPSLVYAYGLGIIFVLTTAIIIYLQATVNGLDYLANAFEQIKFLN